MPGRPAIGSKSTSRGCASSARSDEARSPAAHAVLSSAARAGSADAQLALGDYEATRARHARAVHWYAQAAAQNVPEAMYRLSLCYLHGRGVQQSLAASRRWARLCEEQLERAPAHARAAARHVPNVRLLRATGRRVFTAQGPIYSGRTNAHQAEQDSGARDKRVATQRGQPKADHTERLNQLLRAASAYL
jgi:TPR repeat protein